MTRVSRFSWRVSITKGELLSKIESFLIANQQITVAKVFGSHAPGPIYHEMLSKRMDAENEDDSLVASLAFNTPG